MIKEFLKNLIERLKIKPAKPTEKETETQDDRWIKADKENIRNITGAAFVIVLLFVLAYTVTRPVEFTGEIDLQGNFNYARPSVQQPISMQPIALSENNTVIHYAAPTDISYGVTYAGSSVETSPQVNISVTNVKLQGNFKAPVFMFLTWR